MKKIYILLLICVFPFALAGQSGSGTSGDPYYGTISSTVTWNSEDYTDGKVYIGKSRNEKLSVTSNGSLIINDNVTVIFAELKSLLEINGSGILDINGTTSNPVTLTKSPTKANWKHIYFNSPTSSSSIDHCIIEHGAGDGDYGGGMYIYYASTNVEITNSIIHSCDALYGGGIEIEESSPTIENCIFRDNSGAGIDVYGGTPIITNTTIVANNNPNGSEYGGIQITSGGATIKNCILWNNTQGATTKQDYSGGGTITYSAATQSISGATVDTLSSTNEDSGTPKGPYFEDPSADDYSLQATSPCVDAGTSGTTYDILGNPRVGTTDIGAYENQDFVWEGDDGTNPTYWNDVDNWNRSSVPGSGAVIAINGSLSNYPVVNADATVEDITIASGASLSVSENYYLTVNGTLTNSAGNSGLILKSSSSGDGELISSNEVSATVEFYLTGGTGTYGPAFHYFVPPVASMSIGSDIDAVKTNLGITNFLGDLLLYDETKATSSKEDGWQYHDGYGSTTAFASIFSTRGYNLYLTSADEIDFTGTLNGDQHSYTLSYTSGNDPYEGWNLVGNPYPCNYDLNGISALTGSGDDVNNVVYYNTDGRYASWNVETNSGTNGATSDIIPPMQGFFVLVTATGKSLTLPVSSKTTTSGQSRMKSGSDAVISKLKLKLKNGTYDDETVICLIDDATQDFDGDFDGYKLFGGSNYPYIYTEISNTKYSINAVPGPVAGPVSIPVTVDIKEAGDYKIDITEFENLDEYYIVLKHGDVETSLSKDISYSFTSDAGIFSDFEIIVNDIASGVNNLIQNELKTWYSNYYLYMNYPEDIHAENGKLRIYDIQGRRVYTNNNLSIVPGQTTQIPFNSEKGIYITDIEINNRHYSSKIVVY
jgi:hypothetical protein